MSALPPDDQRKLMASLALLSSPIDGEVVAAARAVTRLLDKHGLDTAALSLPLASFVSLGPIGKVGPVQTDRSASAWRAGEKDHQRLARVLLNSGRAWSDWERQFLASIGGQATVSAGQQDKLEELRTAVVGRKVAA